jgi:hypothetical protein
MSRAHTGGRWRPPRPDRGCSDLTRQRLGWEPSHPGLIDDLDDGHYFDH